ncbi:MAG: STAS domain-containing protein [Planctomycetota bacterium]
MKVDLEKRGAISLVRVGGEIDLVSIPKATPVMDEVFATPPPCVVLNCAGLSVVTSSAISFLVDTTQRARSFPIGDCVISEPSPLLKRSLESLNRDGWVTVFATDDEALAHFREQDLEASIRNESKPPANWRERLREWLRKR